MFPSGELTGKRQRCAIFSIATGIDLESFSDGRTVRYRGVYSMVPFSDQGLVSKRLRAIGRRSVLSLPPSLIQLA